MSDLKAHYEAENWLWNAEQMEAGPFWRQFVTDFFLSAVRQFREVQP